LASDHLVDDCRDPIKCVCCYRSGHKSFQCKATSHNPRSVNTRCATPYPNNTTTNTTPTLPGPRPNGQVRLLRCVPPPPRCSVPF
jgi:hypothetical protein